MSARTSHAAATGRPANPTQSGAREVERGDDHEVAEHGAGALHGAVDQRRDGGAHPFGEERHQDALGRIVDRVICKLAPATAATPAARLNCTLNPTRPRK